MDREHKFACFAAPALPRLGRVPLIGHICAMLDLSDCPEIDKHALVGGCLRLPLVVDAGRLVTEVRALPSEAWDLRGGSGRYPQQGVHQAAETVFLRGYTPAEGDRPIEDRPWLDALPYVRQLVREVLGSKPQRCLLARLPGGASIAPHIDRAPYFAKTIRLHVPVESHEQAWMLSTGLAYRMKPGEVWALNNVAPHGVWNAHPTQSRTHLICDFLPDPGLLALLAAGERDLGRPMPEARAHFAALAQGQAASGG